MSQNDQVDVSVIIPTYNRARLVGEAIESVLCQTALPREIIVVDDGSTDDTLERLVPYESRVTVVKAKHGGIAHARNEGMRKATGTYVAFLDSDDRYLPHKLAVQVQILERFPDVGMVCSEFSGFGDGMTEEFHLKSYHEPAFRESESYEDYFERAVPLRDVGIECPPWSDRKMYTGRIFDQYLRALFIFTNSMMVRRSVLEGVGLQDESFPLFEEYEFALRVAMKCSVAFIDVPTYQLRYHTGQISTTTRADGPAVLVEKQRQLLRVVERHGVLDDVYYRANKTMVDGVMVRLHRALGIALICHPEHEAEARSVLSSGKRYGLSAMGLRLLTYMPCVARRIAMKVYRVISKIRKKA
jgi:glycosyltransferase involved in cell wall biosynthesis